MQARRNLTLIPLLALVLVLVWLKPIDAFAERHVETGFQRALTTFAAARALNAILSTVQSASVSVGLGVGVSAHPGAILEPIDDLVEQFSALMLAATISFAAQRLLLEIFGAWPVSILLSGVLIAWCSLRWQGRSLPTWLTRIALGLLCLRLAVPVLAIGSEATYQLLLARDYEASQSQIKSSDLPDTTAEPGEGLGNKFKHWWSENTDLSRKVDTLRSRADGLVVHIVKLAAVFIVQSMVLPLLFLSLLLRLYRTLSGIGSRQSLALEPRYRRLQSET